MTDDEFIQNLIQIIETELDAVYVRDRADWAVKAAREGVSLEAAAACKIAAKLVGTLDALIHDVAEGRRREPFT